MALVDNAWYINYGNGSSTGWWALTVWPSLTAVAAGVIRRQVSPTAGNERCFVCVVAGTTLVGEPSWTLTRGALTAESAGPTWQECTGIAALNGDATNTPSWTITATPPGGVKGTVVTLGQVIKRDNGASYQICTTAGTAGSGSEPSFSDTAGTTTADNTVTWTSLGVVGNFTGWQAPHARLSKASVATWGQAGNKFYVASVHAETQATAMDISSPGTISNPCKILCVNASGSVPPVSADLRTTATISTTGSNAISLAGYVSRIYGIELSAGGGGANTANISGTLTNIAWTFENCKLTMATTLSTQRMLFGGSTISLYDNIWTFINTKVKFGQSVQCIDVKGRTRVVWKDTTSAIDTSVATPALLFDNVAGGVGSLELDAAGVDFSAITGQLLSSTASAGRSRMMNCKLGSGVVIGGPTSLNDIIDVINCDSGSTNYRHERWSYGGKQQIETTIVRTGGASDGTTPISWKITTTANAPKWSFQCLPIEVWNDSTGSALTATIYGIWGGGAVPNNDEIWAEVEYLGTSGFPVSSFVTCGLADVIAVAAGQTSDSSTWGGSTTKFKLVSPSFTPQKKGPVIIRVYAGKASSTFYIDPKATIA